MNIEKIRPSAATTIIVCTLNVFSVALSFYLLKRETFISMDIVRFIFLCIGFAGPLVASNATAFVLLINQNKASQNEESDALWYLGAGGLFTLLIFNFVLFISYSSEESIKGFYSDYAITQIAFLGIAGTLFMIKTLFTKTKDTAQGKEHIHSEDKSAIY